MWFWRAIWILNWQQRQQQFGAFWIWKFTFLQFFSYFDSTHLCIETLTLKYLFLLLAKNLTHIFAAFFCLFLTIYFCLVLCDFFFVTVEVSWQEASKKVITFVVVKPYYCSTTQVCMLCSSNCSIHTLRAQCINVDYYQSLPSPLYVGLTTV